MYANDALAILEGKVLEVSGQTISIAPGIRVELPPDYARALEIGEHVLIRARRVKGRYIAESVLPEPKRCRHCGQLLTRYDLKDECEACHTSNREGS